MQGSALHPLKYLFEKRYLRIPKNFQTKRRNRMKKLKNTLIFLAVVACCGVLLYILNGIIRVYY